MYVYIYILHTLHTDVKSIWPWMEWSDHTIEIDELSAISSIQVAEAAAATITADALASKELWERCNLSSLKRLKMAENGIKWSVHGLTCLTWPFHQHIAQDWTLCLLRPLSIAVWNPAGALSLADIRRRSCRSQRLRGWEWCNLKMNLYESMNQLENMEKLIAYP